MGTSSRAITLALMRVEWLHLATAGPGIWIKPPQWGHYWRHDTSPPAMLFSGNGGKRCPDIQTTLRGPLYGATTSAQMPVVQPHSPIPTATLASARMPLIPLSAAPLPGAANVISGSGESGYFHRERLYRNAYQGQTSSVRMLPECFHLATHRMVFTSQMPQIIRLEAQQ